MTGTSKFQLHSFELYVGALTPLQNALCSGGVLAVYGGGSDAGGHGERSSDEGEEEGGGLHDGSWDLGEM